MSVTADANAVLLNRPTAMRVTFWGVQGSCPISPTPGDIADFTHLAADAVRGQTFLQLADDLDAGRLTSADLRQMAATHSIPPAPDPRLPSYGGDTTCVEVFTSEGATLLFDLGSGLRNFSRQVAVPWRDRGERVLNVFASHEHLDHRNGLAFSSFLFDPRRPFRLNIHGTRQFLTAVDDRYGIFSRSSRPSMHVDDPIDFRMMSAEFSATEIDVAGAHDVTRTFAASGRPTEEAIVIGQTRITPFEVYHGATHCLGYQVRHGDRAFVFCTDHELRRGSDPADARQHRSIAAEARLRRYCADADLAYFDGQYLLNEYLGSQGVNGGPAHRRMDWGHGCVEDVVERARDCRIRQTLLGHHDPERSWRERVALDARVDEMTRDQPSRVELARAFASFDV